jgi:hypothetical protein
MAKEKEEKPKGLALLREPFPENQISLLPKPTTKDGKKANCKECGGYHAFPAIHLSYVGHAALTDRLLDVDPNWSWEPLALKEGLPAFDATGGLWIKLTICGVTRLGYGHAQTSQYKEIGSREKEVIGDALRNAAMRFGAALDLWHKGELHVEEEEEKKSKEESPKKPVEPKAKKEQKPNGPPKCKTCEAEMRLAKSGKHWYCPNWQDGNKHEPLKVQAKPKIEEVESDPDFPAFNSDEEIPF